MNRLALYFQQKYYPDLSVEQVADAMGNPMVKENAIKHLHQNNYPDMDVNELASVAFQPEAMPSYFEEDVYFDDEKEDPDTFLEKRKHKKGHLSMADAMSYIEQKGLKGKDAFKFLEEWSPSTIATIYNKDGLIKRARDPNYKPPITKEEFDNYELYSRDIEAKKSDKTPEELEAFLLEKKYTAKKPITISGKQIITNAKNKNNKVKIEENSDGSFTIYDDESTFKDTEDAFGKGLRIYPDAKYSKTLYGKGRDLRNVYKPVEFSPYTGRVPTDEEKKVYAEGNYATGALTPEYKYYYANAYLEPNKDSTLMSSKEKPFYAINSSAEDVDRLAEVNKMKDEMSDFYEAYLKKQRRKKARQDFMEKLKGAFNPVGGGGGSDMEGFGRNGRANY
jgi:hypothetical protein